MQGQLPSNWVIGNLGHILSLSKLRYVPESEETLFYVGLEHIEREKGQLVADFAESPVQNLKSVFESGDILYGKLRPYLNKVYLAGQSGVCSTDILVFKTPNRTTASFMRWFMLSRQFVNDMSDNCNGVNLPRVPTSFVQDYPIPLAPLPEQRAIVSKIEQLFSALDNGTANLKKAQAQLKVYRQAVLKKAFNGELTREWRESHTNLLNAEELLKKIKEEREANFQRQLREWKQAVTDWRTNGKPGKQLGKPIAPSNDEGQQNTPIENWVSVMMQNCADVIDPEPSHRTPPKVEGGIPFISTANINKDTGEIDFIGARKVGQAILKEHIWRYSISKGDFVFGKIGTIGKPFWIPTERTYALSANVLLVQPFSTIVIPEFLFYLTKSSVIEKQFDAGTNSTTQAAFGIKKARVLLIPLCSIEEQHQIVQEIETRLSVCDKLEESITHSLQKAEALRQSILKRAFAGQLLTEDELAACRKEKDWEPAGVLLERVIREAIK
jgi:type I restriction enzyme S subunit